MLHLLLLLIAAYYSLAVLAVTLLAAVCLVLRLKNGSVTTPAMPTPSSEPEQ